MINWSWVLPVPAQREISIPRQIIDQFSSFLSLGFWFVFFFFFFLMRQNKKYIIYALKGFIISYLAILQSLIRYAILYGAY